MKKQPQKPKPKPLPPVQHGSPIGRMTKPHQKITFPISIGFKLQ